CADANYYVTLTPSNSVSSPPSTDYFRDHDFYHLKLNSTTSGTLSVEFIDGNGTGTKADLEIALHGNGARFVTGQDLIVRSIANNNSSDPLVSEVDSVTLSSVPAGNYLIQIFSWYGTGGPVRYGLKLNGVKLCQKDP
ncbi:MAG: hypothetical protein KDD34_00560, partial [Bdellovibrionales bacterium]|nr:hypothetical protein [Bdellovibrionales bacterium]